MAKAKAGFKPEDLKKHYFWIVLPLIVVVAFVFTFLAKGKIKKAYEEKTTAVETEKGSVDTIAGNAKHPNQKTIDAIKAETDDLKQRVFVAWTLMYDDQKNRNRWPRQLSTEFRNLVENKLNFRDPIDPSKPYLLEDYGYFIANHLPDLLKSMNRRRCQVKDYKLLKKKEMDNLKISGLEERFWPVYVATDAEGTEFYYIAIFSDPNDEKSPIKDVYLYNVKDDLVSTVDDSALADKLKAQERAPYWRDVDPYITNPKQLITFGLGADLSGIAQAVAAMESGAAGGAMGGGSGMGGGMMGGGMMGGGAMAGGGMGGGAMAGGASSGSGGARGAMGGGEMGGMGGGSLAGLGIGAIPGDGYDPAEEQIPGTTLEELSGGGLGAGGGMGGGAMAGGGMRGGAMGGGAMAGGGMRGGAMGGGAMAGGAMAGGSMGGGATVEDPSWSIAKYPGLPPYKERRRIVGNVDWPNPEVYTLPTWEATAHPTSIEVWYAQETLWVYEALIRVVAETNKDFVDDIANAPIKCVEQMLIGQNAAVQWTTLMQTIGDLTGQTAQSAGGSLDAMAGSSMGSTGGASGDSMGGMMGGVALSGSAEMQALTKIVYGRYLDGENKPLLASDSPPFAEFNKMPVCLKVAIDQRKIPELLTQCANCSMPIDVKHVRISPDNNIPFAMPIPLENMASAEGGSGMMGGGMMGGGMMGGGMGGGMMGGPGGGMGGASSGGMNGSGGARGSMGAGGAAGGDMGGMGGMGGVDVGRTELSQSEYGADTIRVEIYGVINIFNKPNEDSFGTGQEAKDSDSAADVALTEAGAAENAAAAAVADAADAANVTTTPATPAAGTAPAAPAAGTTPATPAAGTAPAAPAAGTTPATPAAGTAPATP